MDYFLTRAIWLVDAASNFTPYMAALFAFAFSIAAAKRSRMGMVGAAVGFIAAVSPIVRDVTAAQVPAHPRDASEEARLRLMTFNVQDINQNYDEVLTYLADSPADVIFLNEAFYVWRLQLIKLAPIFPWHTILTERDLVVLSRRPLEGIEFVNVVGDPARGLLVHVRVGDTRVALLGFHARKPRNAADFALRSRQLEEIAERLRGVRGPVVVAGDFNATSRSLMMQQFLRKVGLAPLDWHWPPISTWPSWLPYLGLQIDHVLTRGGIEVVKAEAGPNLGSNHLPLMTELRLVAAVGHP